MSTTWRVLTAIGLLAAGAGLAAPSTSGPRGDVGAEIVRLQHDWAAAVAARDRDAAGRIIADDFVATDATGHHWDRGRYLAGIAADVSRIESLETDELMVRVYADAAVVTGRNQYKARPGRAGLTGTYRLTNTYVRRPEGWRCVAAHEGRVSE